MASTLTELKGEPFHAPLRGATAKCGDVLMEADLGAIKEAGSSVTMMLAITNTDAYASVDQLATGEVKAGDNAAVAAALGSSHCPGLAAHGRSPLVAARLMRPAPT